MSGGPARCSPTALTIPPHRGSTAVRLQRFFIGPLLDEDEGLARLMQRVQLAARFAVHFFDRASEDVADGVD